ncbi:MAG: hypothetical protein ACR2OC_04275 [Solirubrobacterales bacterium]
MVAISNGDALILICVVVLPIAALSLITVGPLLRTLGKGRFAMEMERPPPAGGPAAEASSEVREAEIRQMLEAKAYRRQARGESPLDIDDEYRRLTEETPATLATDTELVAEIRSLVVARNARRARQGKEPLDVEAEVERQLRDLEDIGQ